MSAPSTCISSYHFVIFLSLPTKDETAAHKHPPPLSSALHCDGCLCNRCRNFVSVYGGHLEMLLKKKLPWRSRDSFHYWLKDHLSYFLPGCFNISSRSLEMNDELLDAGVRCLVFSCTLTFWWPWGHRVFPEMREKLNPHKTPQTTPQTNKQTNQKTPPCCLSSHSVVWACCSCAHLPIHPTLQGYNPVWEGPGETCWISTGKVSQDSMTEYAQVASGQESQANLVPSCPCCR